MDHVLFGSDFPHPEGLADPASYVDELAGPARGVRAQDHGRQPRPADERQGRGRPVTVERDRRRRPATIPATARRRRRAPRRPDRRRRRRHRAHLRRAARRRRGAFGAALVAAGHRARRPGRRSGRRTAPSGSSPCSACSQAGAVLVPVNTRFKGAEAADILAPQRGPGARHRHRLPRHRLRRHAARPGVELPDLETIVVADGPAPDGTIGVGRLPRPGDGRRARRGRPPGRPSAPTTRPTSSSPRARPACPRASCRPTAARCGWPPTGSR